MSTTTVTGTVWSATKKSTSGAIKASPGIVHGIVLTFASDTTSYFRLSDGLTATSNFGTTIFESSLVWTSSGTQSPYFCSLGDTEFSTGIYLVLGGSVQATVLYK